ncbi:MAG: tetratricopeptide repeat protein [Chitinophagia bacterium]|nr:tetratricopeptide repeat protein [Chitinophagia bacterium]
MALPDIMDALGRTSGNADKEVLNNPYVFATPIQKVATEIGTSLNYLKLLIVPHPLSADYSYNSIPYKTFGSPEVLLSIAVHLLISGATIFWAMHKKYRALAFAGAFYMLHLLLVNNLIFNIGATMGERLIFHSSVGFCIGIALLLTYVAERMKAPKITTALPLVASGLVVVGFSALTIDRNPKWKNDKTLFTEDIKVVPNSVLVLGNVAAAYITMSDYETNEKVKGDELQKAIKLLDHALELHPKFVAGYLNQGIAYFKLGQIPEAKRCIDSVKANYPNYPTLKTLYNLLADYYLKQGWNKYGKIGKYPEAIEEFKKGLAIDSTNFELWYNMGGAYYTNKQYREAINAWNMSLQIKPGYQQAIQGMNAAYNALKAAGVPVENPVSTTAVQQPKTSR